MKILVFGGRGQAGTEFIRLAERTGHILVAPPRTEIDVQVFDQLRARIFAEHPDIVVNFTAFHVIGACELAFLDALAVNAGAVREMAWASARIAARFVTVSSDYVFDGCATEPYSEDSEPHPIQAYGVSKRAGELAALAEAGDNAFVVRSCGLYGHSGSRVLLGNFVERRISELAKQKQIEVGSDLRCTPTSARAFAEALFALIGRPDAKGGIYHLTAEGDCSWAEFTEAIGVLSGSSCRVVGVDRHGDYGIVRRPAYSVLANRKAAALGIRLPHWRDALARYLAERKAGP